MSFFFLIFFISLGPSFTNVSLCLSQARMSQSHPGSGPKCCLALFSLHRGLKQQCSGRKDPLSEVSRSSRQLQWFVVESESYPSTCRVHCSEGRTNGSLHEQLLSGHWLNETSVSDHTIWLVLGIPSEVDTVNFLSCGCRN